MVKAICERPTKLRTYATADEYEMERYMNVAREAIGYAANKWNHFDWLAAGMDPSKAPPYKAPAFCPPDICLCCGDHQSCRDCWTEWLEQEDAQAAES
jgi:hypothetical protein